MSIEDLLALPADGGMYELVEGRLVKMPPPSGGGASNTAMTLGAALTMFVQSRGLGAVTGSDGEYVLSKPGEPVTALAPDVAFVRAEHLPPFDTPEWHGAWHVAPDLAVEIASPNQCRPEMAAKAKVYLAAGTRLVWVVWPKYRQVVVLDGTSTLSGEDVLPGFSYAAASLFAPPSSPGTTP
jgi:Uma2 family endonuclease